MPNVAYKQSWAKKLDPRTPDLHKRAPWQAGDAEAAEDVNDLDRSRGALLRVIDILRSFGSIPIMGSWRSPLSEERRLHRMNQTSTEILFLVDRSHPLRK